MSLSNSFQISGVHSERVFSAVAPVLNFGKRVAHSRIDMCGYAMRLRG